MNKQDKENIKIFKATEQPFAGVRGICGMIITTGKSNEDKQRASAVVFRLARLLQEIAITTQDGDVEKGMQMASEAINQSNAGALETVEFLRQL